MSLYSTAFTLNTWTANTDHRTADPEVESLIPAWSHTFVEIDHEIISTVILLLPLIQEGLLSVTREHCAQSTGNLLSQAFPGKKMWLGELTLSTQPKLLSLDLKPLTKRIIGPDFCKIVIIFFLFIS